MLVKANCQANQKRKLQYANLKNDILAFVKKKLDVIIKHQKQLVALTEKQNLIKTDFVEKQTNKKIKNFFNQTNNSKNIFNFNHFYGQGNVIINYALFVNLLFFRFFRLLYYDK